MTRVTKKVEVERLRDPAIKKRKRKNITIKRRIKKISKGPTATEIERAEQENGKVKSL